MLRFFVTANWLKRCAGYLHAHNHNDLYPIYSRSKLLYMHLNQAFCDHFVPLSVRSPGALGKLGTLYPHAEWIKTTWRGLLIHDMPNRVSHNYYVCIGSHAFVMFAHKDILRARVTLTTLYRTLCMHVHHTLQHFWTSVAQ